jgi:hypothetical protein
MTIILVFLLSFVQNYLATVVIRYIALNDPIRSSIWAGLSSTASCVVAILIVVTADRWQLLAPFVAGDMLATYFALRKSK